jgi:hypothetical protein
VRLRLSLLITLMPLLGTVHPASGGALATSPRSGGACGPEWSIVGSPSPGSLGTSLTAVSALSSTDAWAAGDQSDFDGHIEIHPLYLHWDGAAWSVVPSVTPDGSIISDILAISTDDVWAVGSYGPYVQHWDGTEWSDVPVPQVGSFASLTSVSATGPDDVWAAGGYLDEALGRFQTLVLHWDGIEWSIVQTPNFGPDSNGLGDVVAFSPTDVWVTGSTSNEMDLTQRPFTLHWEGTDWTPVRPRIPVENDSELSAISGTQSGRLLLGGQVRSGMVTTYAEEWDGSRWRYVRTANPMNNNWLYDLVVGPTGEAWAVGHGDTGGQNRTFIQHSSGGRFGRQLSPNVPNAGNELFGVTISPDGDVWAVGSSTVNGQPTRSLTLHLCPEAGAAA